MSETHDLHKKIHFGTRIGDRAFFLPHLERLRHTYMVGQTGTGKTSLLSNMILQDLAAGHGVCVLDPHGDLASDILDNIPPSRGDHLVYIYQCLNTIRDSHIHSSIINLATKSPVVLAAPPGF